MNLLIAFSVSTGMRMSMMLVSEGEVQGDLEIVDWKDVLDNHKKMDDYNKVQVEVTDQTQYTQE